jgi:transcriptional regulator of acetoin/glycerol metabolism
MPLKLQAVLLRVLESRRVTPLGAARRKPSTCPSYAPATDP